MMRRAEISKVALPLLLICMVALIGASACTPQWMRKVPDLGATGTIQPGVLDSWRDDPAVASAEEWTGRRAPALLGALLDEIYGPPPPNSAARIVEKIPLAFPDLAEIAEAEQWRIEVGGAAASLAFNLVLVVPKLAAGPVPVIVMENFCGNRAAAPGRPQEVAAPLTPVMSACQNPLADPLARVVLGRHINRPPYEDIMARGYALAMFYPGDVVADDAALAPAALAQLQARGGAIAAWAWLYSRALDALETDTRIDAQREAVWGHSRHGKAALLAAALDTRIDAVIAHQSGRGGASLRDSQTGESVAQITDSFPHWFAPAFAAQQPHTVDQHHLLALIAPRPILLGNGDRDSWSDPQSAYRAAGAASPAYELLGVRGLAQSGMIAPSFAGNISFFMRPGRHGVTSQDWRYFLDFLDAHFKAR